MRDKHPPQPGSLLAQKELMERWGGIRQQYRRRAVRAARAEQEARQDRNEMREAWAAAAQAWELALEYATGDNVNWCHSRIAWCLARSLTPLRHR